MSGVAQLDPDLPSHASSPLSSAAFLFAAALFVLTAALAD
jgi:hypothetical protein